MERLEGARLRAGLTQAAVSRELAISQPHYSKVAGGVVEPGQDLTTRIRSWLATHKAPERSGFNKAQFRARAEVLRLTKSIERQSRQLAQLLSSQGMTASRRQPKRTATRSRLEKPKR